MSSVFDLSGKKRGQIIYCCPKVGKLSSVFDLIGKNSGDIFQYSSRTNHGETSRISFPISRMHGHGVHITASNCKIIAIILYGSL